MKSNEDIIKDNLELIGTMVEDGSTDKEIAKKIGVGYSTYRKYKAQDNDLKQVIIEGKDKKNQEVERALYKCAVGYNYYEQVVTKVKVQTETDKGQILESEEVRISSVQKFKPADLAAQKYWLNNKQKTKWSEDPNKVTNDKKLTKLKEKEVNSKAFTL